MLIIAIKAASNPREVNTWTDHANDLFIKVAKLVIILIFTKVQNQHIKVAIQESHKQYLLPVFLLIIVICVISYNSENEISWLGLIFEGISACNRVAIA